MTASVMWWTPDSLASFQLTTARKGKEDDMGKQAKIKAATKAFRAGDTAEAAIHAAKIHGRTLRRLTDRARPPRQSSMSNRTITVSKG